MDTQKTPLAVAIFAEVLYLFCGLSVVLVPDFAKSFYGSWFHGIDMSTIWNPGQVTTNGFIYGMVTSFIGAYVAAWVFVKIYRLVNKQKELT
ncbi:MAG: DUF5676 family membrane protein [bacterium]|nr:DUF5676 family membrane protein [bacterium]